MRFLLSHLYHLEIDQPWLQLPEVSAYWNSFGFPRKRPWLCPSWATTSNFHVGGKTLLFSVLREGGTSRLDSPAVKHPDWRQTCMEIRVQANIFFHPALMSPSCIGKLWPPKLSGLSLCSVCLRQEVDWIQVSSPLNTSEQAGQPLLILVKRLGNSVLVSAIVCQVLSQRWLLGAHLINLLSPSYMNGFGAMCLNEILIVRSLEGQYGYIILFLCSSKW